MPEDKSLIQTYSNEGYIRQEKKFQPRNRGQLVATGTVAHKVKWHLDRRGGLAELFRSSWCDGEGNVICDKEDRIQQVYVSTTHPGVVKGWHVHPEQTDRFFAVRGAVLLVMIDLTKEDSQYIEVVLDSRREQQTVVVPPGFAHGWIALDHSDGEAWVINMCSHEYTGDNEFRKPAKAAPCSWVRPYEWFTVPSV